MTAALAPQKKPRETKPVTPVSPPTIIVDAGSTTSSSAADPSLALKEVLRKPKPGETRLQGKLVRIDCEGKSIVFVVKVDEKLMRFRTASFNTIQITTYNPEVKGDITCSLRNNENVVICYAPLNDKRAKADGTLKSVEFVPNDFKLK